MHMGGTAVEGVRERFLDGRAEEPQALVRVFAETRATIESYERDMDDTQLAYAARDAAQSLEHRIELLPDQPSSEERLWLSAQEHDLGNQLLTLGARLESAPPMLEAAKRYEASLVHARSFMEQHGAELEPAQAGWVIKLFADSADQFLEARELVVQVGDASRYADLSELADRVEAEHLAMAPFVVQVEGAESVDPGAIEAFRQLERRIAVMRGETADER